MAESATADANAPQKRKLDDNESQNKRVASPFANLNISDDHVLAQVTERTKCPSCQKVVKYFCYKCYKVVSMERDALPHVDLPVHLDIIKHELETDGKSTAVHARILADKDVDIYTWQNMPEYTQPERTLLLFPSPDAKRLQDIPRDSFDKIVVIDGTWKQAGKIARETPSLQAMQKVTIAPRKTVFWRFQQKGENHLATIEAIYYLYREFGESYEGDYDGRYDNLLFYYRFFYNLIQDKYKTSSKAFTHRHRKDYIQYEKDS